MKRENIWGVTLFLVTTLLFLWLVPFFSELGFGQPYNSTYLVNTTVNITNAAPNVLNVVIPTFIDLLAYDNVTVQCNFTVYDFDNNTVGANATFYYTGAAAAGPQDQNFRYLNTSCTRMTPFDFYTNYTCTFSVNYFANNGTWFCNATGIDGLDGAGTNVSSGGAINPLVAIKMDPLLDYGELGVNQESNDTLANVTNAGNRDANISVQGGGNVLGDGLSFNCTFGSINVDYERYDSVNGTAWSAQTPLTVASAMISNFYVRQRTDEAQDSINATYWRLKIPIGAGGVCNGKILFTASDRGN